MQHLKNRIHQHDALEFCKKLSPNSIDLIICDGPYGVTNHSWDKVGNIQEYNLRLIQLFSELLVDGGSLYLFGKSDCIDFIDYRKHLQLKSKIVWYQPSRLAQGRLNYTNNYDLICYFTKGKPRCFNLDDIRVPQMVELEHRKRCENVPSVKNGTYKKTRFHAEGKNPGNVWGDIKQLTYKSKELLDRKFLNTVQKPESLMRRLILASTNKGDLVFDPFCGSGTVPVCCLENGRDFMATEINPEFCNAARNRIRQQKSKKQQLSML